MHSIVTVYLLYCGDKKQSGDHSMTVASSPNATLHHTCFRRCNKKTLTGPVSNV